MGITIQKILNENGLGTKIDRWLALEAQDVGKAIKSISEQPPFLEKLNPCFRERHVKSGPPGELLLADTFFVGSLKGVGKVCTSAVAPERRRVIEGCKIVLARQEAPGPIKPIPRCAGR